MIRDWKVSEYGSEFPLERCTGDPVVDGNGYVHTRSGRDALRLVASSLKANGFEVVLLPCYCCECMEWPFMDVGMDVVFYRVLEGFKLDVADIEAKLTEAPRSALLYMSYYGLPPIDEGELLSLKGTHGLVVVRDVTHDLLDYDFAAESRIDDYAVASLRKWAGIPDGGIAYSASCALNGSDLLGGGSFADLRAEAMSLKARYLTGGDPSLKPRYLEGLAHCNDLLDSLRETEGMSPASRSIAGGLDWDAVSDSRRRNSAVLSDGLAAIGVQHWHQPASSPLWVPFIPGSDRDELQRRMSGRNLYCPYLWPLPPSARGVSAWVDWLVGSMLCLPCDQRYDEDDMRAELSILKDCLGEVRVS